LCLEGGVLEFEIEERDSHGALLNAIQSALGQWQMNSLCILSLSGRFAANENEVLKGPKRQITRHRKSREEPGPRVVYRRKQRSPRCRKPDTGICRQCFKILSASTAY
jgi:hypothetical protein